LGVNWSIPNNQILEFNHRVYRERMTMYLHKEFPLKEITERMISCAIEVHKTLGPGLLESLYEEASEYEFE